MISYDRVVKLLILLLCALFAAMILIAHLAIRAGKDAAGTAMDKYEQLEETINWRKL
jgi:hypothetical protein